MNIAIGPSSFAAEDSSPLALLREAGLEVIPNPVGRKLTEEEIILHLKDADALIAGLEPLNRRVMASAKRLRAIARVGIGMENVDQAAAKDLGIKVSNTPEGPTDAVAEMTVAAMLALVRQIIPSDHALHERRWIKIMGSGLAGEKVLLIGYGRIGRRVAELLRTFGADILVCDPAFAVESDLGQGCRAVSLAEGLREAGVISLHAGGAAQILGNAEFAQMRAGVIFLNSARGGLVDEAALVAALENGKVSRAWLDVFREEPYKGPLTRYPQVLLTPHIGTYTRQCRLSMETMAVRNLLRDLALAT